MISIATPTVVGLSDVEQDALNDLLELWRSKRERNLLRAGFYDMKTSTRLLMSSSAPDVVKQRAFVLGWSAISVDKLNRRCNLEDFYDANGNDLDSLGLSEIVDDNRLLDEFSQAGISSLIHTPSWVITHQGDAGEPDVLVTFRDALTGAGRWDGRLRSARYYMSIDEFDEDGIEPTALTLLMHGKNIVIQRVRGKWSVVSRSEHSYGVAVDPLRYRPRLGRPLGSSRISRAVMSIHQQALAAMIRADVNGEAYSLPRYVLLGVTESAFQNPDGSPKPALQAAWDAVWAIGDDESAADDRLARADVKQFHGQSPEPQNAHLRMLAQMFSGETGIPLGELGIIGDSNPTSHEALESSRDDIIAEAEQVTRTWTPDVSSALRRAIAMKNRGDVPDDLKPMPRWRPAQHISKAAAADAGSKVIDKAPWLADTEVGLELLGLTTSQIERARAEKSRADGVRSLGEILERARVGQVAPEGE